MLKVWLILAVTMPLESKPAYYTALNIKFKSMTDCNKSGQELADTYHRFFVPTGKDGKSKTSWECRWLPLDEHFNNAD